MNTDGLQSEVASVDAGTPGGSATVHWGEIDGVSIDFPMVVPKMNTATLTWSVPLDAAAKLLCGDAFEVADMGGDTAMLVVALVDYIDNPWGDYDEANFGLLVHPVGEPERIGAFQWRMPVNQAMTCKAGNEVLGLPKTVDDLAFAYTDDQVTVELAMQGEHALTVTFPRVQAVGEPSVATTPTYSYIDGRPSVVPLTIQLPAATVEPTEVELVLGLAPVAQELRSLGLPRAPELVVWGEGLSGTFGHPEALD